MIIGSRGSPLALRQARWVAAQLPGAEIAVIKTTGDKITDAPLAQVGGTKALFTKEIEEALLDGRIDFAVHSMKDLPVEIDARLTIAAVPAREDARDALVGSRLAKLPEGAAVGTSSLRRAAQLRHVRPDLRVENLRGNVDTRLRKLDEGRYSAIVLAAAGLRRLGLAGRITEVLEPEVMCPAIGQGALAIQARAGDERVLAALAPLDNAAARIETTAERAMLAELGGGCQVPVGGSARVAGDRLRLVAVVASPDGAEMLRASLEGPASDPGGLGRRAAQELLSRGAGRILEQVYAP
ncbi:MAG TPA: hydroxymethylbilane synthase [Bryobacterales bacterium]|nr:hydroxymethylbilane synthase [Bryobacterales bacterium]